MRALDIWPKKNSLSAHASHSTHPPSFLCDSDTYESDDDELDDAEDAGESNAPRSDAVRVVELDELMTEQNAVVSEVSAVLSLPTLSVGVLLRAFKWNRERLFERFYADREGVLKECGVQFCVTTSDTGTGEAEAVAGASGAAKTKPEEELHCEICFEDVSADNSFSLGCQHRFCRLCWHGYLTNEVSEGTRCVFSTCPAQGCKEVVTEDVFVQILNGESDEQQLTRYRKFLLDAFVDTNKCMRWCPSPYCTNALAAPSHTTSVRCKCGCAFCFHCGEPAHEPINCDLLSKWLDKCQNESETANWILSHTKRCPKCQTRIEKNQGCNHMTCRAAGCGHEFCWICMGPWSEHGTETGGYYKCNRFVEQELKDTASEADKAKRELDRYLHYFKRYQNHAKAEEFAASQRGKIAQRMEQIAMEDAGGGTSWIDAQFLKTANEQLIECRRVLKYSYAFGFYLEPGTEKNLFEHLQEMLEKHTEQLSEHTEKPTDRSDVINFTRVTERFMGHLLQGIEDGLTGSCDGGGGGGDGGTGTMEVDMKTFDAAASTAAASTGTTTGAEAAR